MNLFSLELVLIWLTLLQPNNIYVQLICNDIWSFPETDLHNYPCQGIEQWTKNLNWHTVNDKYSIISINACKYIWNLEI